MMRRHAIGSWTTVLALVFALGWGIGRESGPDDTLEWRTGDGLVGSRVFTVTDDGDVYGARDSIPTWVDATGSWHDGGWPDCLEMGGTTVRFAAGPLTSIEGVGVRAVLAVDCRR